MPTTEPLPTGWLLTVVGLLLAVSALVSRVAHRTGVPAVLIFLAIGMLAGSEGPGRLFFEDYALSFRLGTIALALILFDGGLNTSTATIRRCLAPAAILATLGVLATGLVVACGARLFGFGWPQALLLGAVVSSTDAAAVFSVLRGSGLRMRQRVAATLEIESGGNDPIAVACTIGLTQALLDRDLPGFAVAAQAASQLVVGGVLGLLLGFAGRWLLAHVQVAAGGLYPVLTLAFALLSFGLATLASGSGFLSVYVAGIVIGNGPLPYRVGLLRVHDFLAWGSQVLMFLTLGLLVFPSRLLAVAPVGFGIALWLAFVARPAVVALCLAPFRYEPREVLYVGWMGLRGAVPIVLATYPVLMGLEGAHAIFDVVFFVVVLSVLLQGTTAPWLTRRLGLGAPGPPAPPAVLEIASRQPLASDLAAHFIHSEAAVAGVPIGEIPLPPGAAVVVIVRGPELLPAQGHLQIQPGDHVYVVSRPEDRPQIELLFGRSEVD